MKLAVTPTHDSDNSDPPEVTFSESQQGNVIMRFKDPPREVTIRKEDFNVIANVVVR